MERIVFQRLEKNQSINRWNLSEPSVQRFSGLARPMPDNVSYQFVNGWVDTGDLPCREAWRKHIADRSVEKKPVVFPDAYCGFENPRVDFSCFCFQPTVLGRWARCKLRVAAAQRLRFKATTCGGMTVWCNQCLSLVHEPYSRNTPASAEFTLSVSAGVHELTVYSDDMHERDTSCFFQLQLLNGIDVEAGLVTRSDPRRLSEIERMMAGLRTLQVFHSEGRLSITSDVLPIEPARLTLHAGNSSPGQQSASPRAL